MGMRAPQRVAPEHPGHDQVAGVGELARHLRHAVGTPDALADVAELELAGRGLRHVGRGEPHRVEDLRVARAAAEVARERLADLVVRRVRRPRQQVDGGDDEARRAEAALHGARPRRTPPARGAAARRRRDPRRSSPRARAPARRARGRRTRASRRAAPSTSRTRPARRRSWRPGSPSFSRST